jgi:hypothetical protein
MISIWFFVGCLLTPYGGLILVSGIRNYSGTMGREVAMSNLHLPIWWGILLLVMGLAYIVWFRPRQEKGSNPDSQHHELHAPGTKGAKHIG